MDTRFIGLKFRASLVFLILFSLDPLVFLNNSLRQEAAAATIPKIIPPEIKNGKQEISLPDIVDDIDVGGGGRYLALHFKRLRKIGIFDVNRLKIVNYVPARDKNTKFAAGATKLIVVSGDSSVAARWDLATGKREISQSIELNGPRVHHVVLGSASAGPALVCSSGLVQEVDIDSLRSRQFSSPRSQYSRVASGDQINVSANGNVLGIWAGKKLQAYVRDGDTWVGHFERSSSEHPLPSPDGKLIYTTNGIFTNQLQRLGETTDSTGYSIPALHGPYYLTVIVNDQAAEKVFLTERVFLKVEGDDRSLAKIPNLGRVLNSDDRFSQRHLTLDKRLFLIPAAEMVLQLAHNNRKLIAVKFDAEKAIEESGIDHLVVTSSPPPTVTAGEKLSYHITAKSKSSRHFST